MAVLGITGTALHLYTLAGMRSLTRDERGFNSRIQEAHSYSKDAFVSAGVA